MSLSLKDIELLISLGALEDFEHSMAGTFLDEIKERNDALSLPLLKWQKHINRLSDRELISLVKGIVVAGSRLKWSGGSTACEMDIPKNTGKGLRSRV